MVKGYRTEQFVREKETYEKTIYGYRFKSADHNTISCGRLTKADTHKIKLLVFHSICDILMDKDRMKCS